MDDLNKFTIESVTSSEPGKSEYIISGYSESGDEVSIPLTLEVSNISVDEFGRASYSTSLAIK